MATPKQPSITLLLLFALVIVALSFTGANASDCVGPGNISVYWGQKSSSDQDEGTLMSACATGNYDIVILESLIVFDDDSTPELDLANHCGTTSDPNPCSNLEPDINFCQEQNIKVFLSIGQERPKPTLKTTNRCSIATTSKDAAEKLAKYLLDNFLSGRPGPLGRVSLDGIDIADVTDGENLKWPEVLRAINASTTARRIYLSASPQCNREVRDYLDEAIKTGLFDYLWVEFFHQNPCIYADGKATKLLTEWEEWTKSVPNSLIFLGLVGMETTDIAGYISPKALLSDVLPTAKKASNYGGVMIYDRYFDQTNKYSPQIKASVPKVCKCVCDGDHAFASEGFYGLRSASSLPQSM